MRALKAKAMIESSNLNNHNLPDLKTKPLDEIIREDIQEPIASLLHKNLS